MTCISLLTFPSFFMVSRCFMNNRQSLKGVHYCLCVDSGASEEQRLDEEVVAKLNKGKLISNCSMAVAVFDCSFIFFLSSLVMLYKSVCASECVWECVFEHECVYVHAQLCVHVCVHTFELLLAI